MNDYKRRGGGEQSATFPYSFLFTWPTVGTCLLFCKDTFLSPPPTLPFPRVMIHVMTRLPRPQFLNPLCGRGRGKGKCVLMDNWLAAKYSFFPPPVNTRPTSFLSFSGAGVSMRTVSSFTSWPPISVSSVGAKRCHQPPATRVSGHVCVYGRMVTKELTFLPFLVYDTCVHE